MTIISECSYTSFGDGINKKNTYFRLLFGCDGIPVDFENKKTESAIVNYGPLYNSPSTKKKKLVKKYFCTQHVD